MNVNDEPHRSQFADLHRATKLHYPEEANPIVYKTKDVILDGVLKILIVLKIIIKNIYAH